MSRVERTDNPSQRRGSDEARQAQRGRRQPAGRREPTKPSKAEGEVADVEEALRKQADDRDGEMPRN